MFDNYSFDLFFLVILIIHFIYINSIIPKESEINKGTAESIVKVKRVDKRISDSVYAEIKEGIIHIYNNEDKNLATNQETINVFDQHLNKLVVRNVELNKNNEILMENYSKFNIYRNEGVEQVNIDFFFGSEEDKQSWKKAIIETTHTNIVLNWNGTVLLNDMQGDIQNYLKQTKPFIKIINDNNSNLNELENATANLMILRDKIDNKIKLYSNQTTIDNIISGRITKMKNIKNCMCSVNKLRTLTLYLNIFLIMNILIFMLIKYFNEFLELPLLSESVYTIKLMTYSLFLISGTLLNGYLLTKCRCSIPHSLQRLQAILFVILFPILILIQMFKN